MSAGCKLEPRAIAVDGYGGVGLNVWDYGGSGPPLLLCHCTGAAGRIWDPVVAHLEGRFRVFAPDTRGHGDSDKPPERDAHAWINAGRDVLAAVDALGLGSGAKAAGHSGGAAHVAYAEMLRPATFSRVLLMDAIIGPRAVFAGESPLAIVARRRRSVFDSREGAFERFRRKRPMSRWSPEALQAYVDHALAERADGQIELKCPRNIEAWHYEAGGACDLFERLDELQFEALLLTGSDSEVAPLVEMQGQRLPNATRRILENTAHFLPQEKPKAVAELLIEWFT